MTKIKASMPLMIAIDPTREDSDLFDVYSIDDAQQALQNMGIDKFGKLYLVTKQATSSQTGKNQSMALRGLSLLHAEAANRDIPVEDLPAFCQQIVSGKYS